MQEDATVNNDTTTAVAGAVTDARTETASGVEAVNPDETAAADTTADSDVAKDAEADIEPVAEPAAGFKSIKIPTVFPENSIKVLPSDLMKSITANMPTIDTLLSPSTRNALNSALSISATLPKSEAIASVLATSGGFKSIAGMTDAASILPASGFTQGLLDSISLPSISTLWAEQFSKTNIVNSLGLASLTRGWTDLLPTDNVISSLLPPMKPLLGELATFNFLGGNDTGIFKQLDWITQFTRDLKLARTHLPSNWREVDLEPDDLEEEVRAILEEGIPLAWVPSGRVIELLLAAPDAPSRRRVITNNHKGILSDCERVVSRLAVKRALFYVDMIRKAIRALRDGHVEAAQSLATNVLDTLVNHHTKDALGVPVGVATNASSYKKFKRQSWRLTLAVHPVTTIMSGRFTVEDRPDGYRRNATAHAITKHQYNRINAVLAIMNATSLLTCYVRDTPAFDSRVP